MKKAQGSCFWRAFGRNQAALFALVFLLMEILAVLLLPLLLGVDPNKTDPAAGFWALPGGAHPLGTDEVGRDVLARLLHGGRVSLLVGFSSAALALVIGVTLGLLAGYRAGWLRYGILRLVDVVQSFPSMILVLCLVSFVGPSVWNLVLVLGLLGWPSIARLMYGNTLSVMEEDYILAVRTMGAGEGHILLCNVLPNAIAPVWAALPLRVGRAILSESSLSFLGVGLRTPEASWGNLMQGALSLATLTQRPWIWLPPCLLLIATVFALQFVGEGLRTANEPRGRG